MQSKPIAAIIVLSLLVTSLLVSGCTVDFPKKPLPTPPPTPDPQLTKYVDAYHQTLEELYPSNVTAFSVTWINDTTAQIRTAFTYTPKRPNTNTTSGTYSENDTVIKFSSADEATKYVYSHATDYRLMSTSLNSLNNSSFQHHYRLVNAYKLAMGYTPIVHVYYGHDSSSSTISGSGYFRRYAEQNTEYLWFVDCQASVVY
jgi:hypothetical protein